MDTDSEKAPCASAQQPILKLPASLACSSTPTIDDVGNALYSRSILPDRGFSSSKSVVFPSLGGRGCMDKSEKKYTLKIMTCATEVAEDGYKWRKYGQKFIKNSSNPRSYYRCTNPGCNAKKQVERSKDDPQMLVIAYQGVHLHYASSHLFLPRPLPPERRKQPPSADLKWMIQDSNGVVALTDSAKISEQEVEETVVPERGGHRGLEDPGWKQQGLLEDIVPFLLRRKP